jgi:hypothetical protein|uniref:Uncharacterized protein n=1 Tax=viral metagenome TaxID=1070528 RepID=A0A6C0BRI2_9ZZZZ
MDCVYLLPTTIVIIVSFVLTILEPCNYNEDPIKKMFFLFVIFIHHAIQFVWFVIPLIYGHKFPKRILYFIITGLIYVFIQNVFIFKNENTQTCILSKYTNSMCLLSPTSPLRDVMYYLGMKKNLNDYNTFYNTYIFMYTFYLLYLVNFK